MNRPLELLYTLILPVACVLYMVIVWIAGY